MTDAEMRRRIVLTLAGLHVTTAAGVPVAHEDVARAIVVALKEGARAAFSIASVGVGLPGRSARAFLRGAYHLDGKSAQPALHASMLAAVVATAIGAIAVIAALVFVLLVGSGPRRAGPL